MTKEIMENPGIGGSKETGSWATRPQGWTGHGTWAQQARCHGVCPESRGARVWGWSREGVAKAALP